MTVLSVLIDFKNNPNYTRRNDPFYYPHQIKNYLFSSPINILMPIGNSFD